MDQQISAMSVSVIMPTYNQVAFINRAVASLELQTHEAWELIIINDGSTDSTHEVVQPLLKNSKILYLRNDENLGLGECLNIGIDNAKYDLIAYLPSDDIYYKNHLNCLCSKLITNDENILAYANMKFHYYDGVTTQFRQASGNLEEMPLQLVQVLHKKTKDRWMCRRDIVTDSLDFMFWDEFLANGKSIFNNEVTCEWVSHPKQRHKIISENFGGGIYLYKQFYNVKHPIVFESKSGNHIDEIEYFKKFQQEVKIESNNKLKILLVGELAYNAERIYAFEERGHQLYGLWMDDPFCYNTTGPLPFGNVIDIPYDGWLEKIKEIKPDIIYALLNYPTVKFAHRVLIDNPGIPFVWHFKEGPFFCRQAGTWNELIELFTKSDGQIFGNKEIRQWFLQFLPQNDFNNSCTHILDGDLPKADWFTDDVQPLLSDSDGEIHTVVPGRPFGLVPQNIVELAKEKIHLHFYGDVQQRLYTEWILKAEALAPGYLHIHPNCNQEDWVKEFSQYDAGWLHFFESENNGEIIRAEWNDLNYPARMATLACAGLPMLQRDNSNHIVATQALSKKHDIGVFFNSFTELSQCFTDKERMKEIRANVWKSRMTFSFDYHVDTLINFFRKIIAYKKVS